MCALCYRVTGGQGTTGKVREFEKIEKVRENIKYSEASSFICILRDRRLASGEDRSICEYSQF